MDIVDKLTVALVPTENRVRWLNDTMNEAANEIVRLRQTLQQIADWKGGTEWPMEIAQKALNVNAQGEAHPNAGGEV